jgi:hypothetical protein
MPPAVPKGIPFGESKINSKEITPTPLYSKYTNIPNVINIIIMPDKNTHN